MLDTTQVLNKQMCIYIIDDRIIIIQTSEFCDSENTEHFADFEEDRKIIISPRNLAE